jgi:hypothetical protein
VNRVFVIGGMTEDSEIQNKTYVMSQRRGQWRFITGPPLPSPRAEHSCGAFRRFYDNNYVIVVAGGRQGIRKLQKKSKNFIDFLKF